MATTATTATVPVGGNKSLPAKKVDLPENLGKYIAWGLGALALVVGLSMVVGLIREHHASSAATTPTPATAAYVNGTSDPAGVLVMPPSDDTAHIILKGGQVASLTGTGFSTHVRFADGSECVLGKNSANPTCTGPMIEEWGHDESGKANNLSYVVH